MVSNDLFGFKSAVGTREAILILRKIVNRRHNTNRKIYITFIDLQKYFDTVNWILI